MSRTEHDPLTFHDCERRMNGHGTLRLHHNTWLHRIDEDTFAVLFHQTYIIYLDRDGTFRLNSGGYRTYTTKERLNRFTPFRIYSVRRQWFIRLPGGQEMPFEDGLEMTFKPKEESHHASLATAPAAAPDLRPVPGAARSRPSLAGPVHPAGSLASTALSLHPPLGGHCDRPFLFPGGT